MMKVSEYEQHAAKCRQMARDTADPEQKAQLEEMADAWDALARDRAEHIKKGMIAAVERPHTQGDRDKHN
jgi:hypothetical protein